MKYSSIHPDNNLTVVGTIEEIDIFLIILFLESISTLKELFTRSELNPSET